MTFGLTNLQFCNSKQFLVLFSSKNNRDGDIFVSKLFRRIHHFLSILNTHFFPDFFVSFTKITSNKRFCFICEYYNRKPKSRCCHLRELSASTMSAIYNFLIFQDHLNTIFHFPLVLHKHIFPSKFF
jgi:hypothetical protein